MGMRSYEELATAVAGVTMLFLFMTLILFLCMLPGFFKGRYARKIRRAIRVSTNTVTLPVITRVFCLVINMNQSVTTTVVRFVGHGREQRHLMFGDPAVCEKVLEILRRRFGN